METTILTIFFQFNNSILLEFNKIELLSINFEFVELSKGLITHKDSSLICMSTSFFYERILNHYQYNLFYNLSSKDKNLLNSE